MSAPGKLRPLWEATCQCGLTVVVRTKYLESAQRSLREAGWSLKKDRGWTCPKCVTEARS
jgi:hypothetical protein